MNKSDLPLLTRTQAVEFIRDELGVPVAPSTIDKKSMRGDGPPVKKWFGRRALYAKADLRQWALSLTSDEPTRIDAG